MEDEQNGFSLIEIIIVIAIIGVLVSVTIVAFKPQEIFINGRNSNRVSDIRAINTAIGQWLSRDGVMEEDPYFVLGLTAPGVTALTPSDGSITGEGVAATSVTQLLFPAYLEEIPRDPDGTTEYRIGINNLADPTHILVCTDTIEHTSSYSESGYPNGIFCQSS
ncbi:prepilin-type N-terminal cleavage/methylation domain-containing protein [Candidatus Dojkabacteria bacterium]|nr:prepilin-type N-terminal cleavage/methylation domain-containing protein [Candidatus Dojkabacteria bacterium]